MALSRLDVLAHRIHVQQLDRTRSAEDTAVLDLGVQETGPDGGRWALELRKTKADDLLLAWSLRGAPHWYRRSEAAQVAAAVAPWSDADATKRTLDAGKQLKAAGIGVLAGLAQVAQTMREVVTKPTTKGELSAELTRRLPEPFLRWCNPCQATHTYEQPFRLSALQAGLELEPGTSPPVLRGIPGWRGPAKQVPAHLDVVRATLHLLGPSTPKLVAGYLDAPVKEVTERWPEDVEQVDVDGQALDVLSGDAAALRDAPRARGVLLLGPYDLFLQGRDRELVVPDAKARTELWKPIGRPGGLLVDGEVVGTWRPRAKDKKLQVAVEVWSGAAVPEGVEEQAERLADFRGVDFVGLV